MHLMIDQLMAHSHLRYKGEALGSPHLPAWGGRVSGGGQWLIEALAGTLSMLQCDIFPGLPADFLDSEVNLFLVPFMDSEAESETPPRAGGLPGGTGCSCPGGAPNGQRSHLILFPF